MLSERVKTRPLGAVAALAVALLGVSQTAAEDLKGKFYLGGSLGILVTTDNVRNNAALIISPLGADGAPFTGDEGEEVSCESGRSQVFCDPRPDDLIARQAQIEQTIKGDIRIGYGLTSALSVEFSAGYFEGDLKNIDVYTTKFVPISTNPFDPCLDPNNPKSEPCNLNLLKQRDIKEPFAAAVVTEIPLELNAIVRFRKDSNLNPYLGGGIGYLITDVEVSDSVDEINARFESLHLTQTTDEFGPAYGKVFSFSGDGNAEFRHPLEVTIDDGFQWQFVGGVDYFFSDLFSMHFEAKYALAKTLPWAGDEETHRVSATFKGEDQINLTGFPEDLYRKDGSLKIFHRSAIAPNPVIDPNGSSGRRYSCDFDNNQRIEASDFGHDYDGNGDIDQCFNPGSGVSDPLSQTLVAQGGKIDLTSFTFGFGIKFHF